MPQGSARAAEGMVNGHRASFHARLVAVGSGVTRHNAHISETGLLWDPEKPFMVITPTGPWAPVATEVRHLGARGDECAGYGKASVQIPALEQSYSPERLLHLSVLRFPLLTRSHRTVVLGVTDSCAHSPEKNVWHKGSTWLM